MSALAPRPLAPHTAPARVLIVDDDDAFGEVIADVLSERGYETVCLPDPNQALEKVGQGGFSAAIVDLVMPQMGGLELAGQLKARVPDLQVLMLTGHADMSSAVEGIKRGVFAYLQKGEARMGVLEQTLADAVELGARS